MSAERPLAGRVIVVTRPREQSRSLADLITQAGGDPLLFPALEIRPPREVAPLERIIDRLESFDLAIFVSPIAVDRAIEAIKKRREIPDALRVAAVGGGSARALHRHGFAQVVAPSRGSDSESLLECAELQDVAGEKVVIFRGEGGRELMGQTLTARGASVEYAECYRRRRPEASAAPLVERAARGDLHGFVVTSSEGLRNLHSMLGEDAGKLLAASPLFVPHPRVAAVARELSLANIVETGSGDEAMVAAMKEYFSRLA